ncbi:MAG: hypothetical protein ACKOA8_17005 [Deltaproteobacteria bacterium]
MKRKMKKDLKRKTQSQKLVVRLGEFMGKYGVRSLKFLILGTVTLLLSTGTAYGAEAFKTKGQRQLSSLQFPLVETERSTDDILDSYPVYLKFVIEVGQNVDRAKASRLVKVFELLKRKNPKGAALFLKGLRFEMIQKVDLMGKDPRDITTSTPEYRRWIAKYLNEWVREADEHLFRAYSASHAELALSE